MRSSRVGFEAGDFRSQTGVDVGLGPMQTDYRECIGKDIGYGCREEDGMLWVVVGRRLGVDLWALLWLAVEFYVLNSGARIDVEVDA